MPRSLPDPERAQSRSLGSMNPTGAGSLGTECPARHQGAPSAEPPGPAMEHFAQFPAQWLPEGSLRRGWGSEGRRGKEGEKNAK